VPVDIIANSKSGGRFRFEIAFALDKGFARTRYGDTRLRNVRNSLALCGGLVKHLVGGQCRTRRVYDCHLFRLVDVANQEGFI
jgi:hypothetical protein